MTAQPRKARVSRITPVTDVARGFADLRESLAVQPRATFMAGHAGLTFLP
eukprot:CAMPEP_0197715070 /NCGR_PEP_ID=MMETSP1434-20131217/244_1 /TAXON_ID=265543 /ORGANISM="Minutocellus polymorphus, Strain CCMP3303" /LENGTH=49 /DNA_ID= /DNA_START= /DNA_END= /DNA_ORIENTATION=